MKKDVESILKKLKAMHGEPRAELNWSNPLELTVAVVLSAQCTDERVNKVTEYLFTRYRTLQDYLDAPLEKLEEEIRPTGFYRNKARSLKNIAAELKERFGSRVPEDIDTLATIKGIGRKSANMIVGLAYGTPAIIVDTHVTRVSNRLGLTSSEDAGKIEQDLAANGARRPPDRFLLASDPPRTLYLQSTKTRLSQVPPPGGVRLFSKGTV